MLLKGKTAIVTGAGRGIGEGIALALGREGANVVLTARKMNDIAAVAEKIKAQGGKALPITADAGKKADCQAMAAAAIKEFGAIDILVNNAGIEATPMLLKDIPEEQWDRVVGVNLKGVFLSSQAVIPQMMKQNRGRIINISSLAGRKMTFFGSADYTASKHGVTGLTLHLAWELADSHITVNAICPGATLTPLAEHGTTPQYREMVTKRLIPLGRWCTAEDIASAVLLGSGDDLRLVRRRVVVQRCFINDDELNVPELQRTLRPHELHQDPVAFCYSRPAALRRLAPNSVFIRYNSACSDALKCLPYTACLCRKELSAH